MSDLDVLLREQPHLHGWNSDGTAESWSLAPEVLARLERLIRPGMRTLETGAGFSTVLFASAGTQHTCICPAADEIERIRTFCGSRNISVERVNFVVEGSETALPALDLEPLDLVLIDGSHSFPTVFIDWYYSARALKLGGTVLVDDVHLWTGRVLRDFLRAEPDWEMVDEITMRSAVFVKRANSDGVREWLYQPFVARRSLTTPARRAWQMLLDGDLSPLMAKGRSRLAAQRRNGG